MIAPDKTKAIFSQLVQITACHTRPVSVGALELASLGDICSINARSRNVASCWSVQSTMLLGLTSSVHHLSWYQPYVSQA